MTKLAVFVFICLISWGIPAKASDYISGGNEAEPHEFPWIVRIGGGCVSYNSMEWGHCGGSLVSPHIVVTSYHCAVGIHPVWDYETNEEVYKPCDHSDGKRKAFLGRHEFLPSQVGTYQAIPIIDVRYPPNADEDVEENNSHDFAIYILKYPAQFSKYVMPICLPKNAGEMQKYYGKKAIAAGWGQTRRQYGGPQSTLLQKVELEVDKKRYKHYKMFGTKTERNNNGIYKDPCRGDSGGPLMLPKGKRWVNVGGSYERMNRYILIGTVHGAGYICATGARVDFEGTTNGMWNKVAYWVKWIKKEMKKVGDRGCFR